MLRPASTVSGDDVVATSVCVVGSGPAGLTVADGLDRAGIDTIVVETGARGFEPAVQGLSAVTQSGHQLVTVQANRRRQVGGNSNVWVVKMADLVLGVRYLPLDEADFASHPHQPHSGWPFSRDELKAHYQAAQEICQAGPYDYSPSYWSQGTDGPWKLDGDEVESKVFQFGPKAAFHDTVADRLAASRRVTLLTEATATELLSAEADGPITAVRCRTIGGRTITVAADRFVVAGGGLGNPHLLLASRGTRPAGVGNHNDLVGRFLQDHPIVGGGHLEVADRNLFTRSTYYDLRAVDGTSGLGHLALTADAIDRHGLGGLSATLFPRPSARRSRTMELLREYYETARARELDRTHLARLPQLAAGLDYLAIAVYRKQRWGQSTYYGFGRGGWSQMPDLARKFTRFEIIHQAEQSPDPENRVTLNRELDAVGMPTLNVRWRWSESDANRAARGRRLIAQTLERSGLGRVVLPDDGDLPAVGVTGGTAHYMGTTRMHADPHHGVVDADGKVHGVPNLWVAGSSVFPTSGYANPTLTIVALAHRLARHLADHR